MVENIIMYKIKIYFTINKNPKEKIKIGTSFEDCWWKIEMDYRMASKPPILIKFEILEEYYPKKSYKYDGPNQYELEMDKIRENTEFSSELLEMFRFLPKPVHFY